jgi:hypothetical protein
MPIARRSLLIGLSSLIAAPAIVRAGSLELVRGIVLRSDQDRYNEYMSKFLLAIWNRTGSPVDLQPSYPTYILRSLNSGDFIFGLDGKFKATFGPPEPSC